MKNSIKSIPFPLIFIFTFIQIVSGQTCKPNATNDYDEETDRKYVLSYGNTVYSEGFGMTIHLFAGKDEFDNKILYLLHRSIVPKEDVNLFNISKGSKLIILTEDEKVVRLNAMLDQKATLWKSKNYVENTVKRQINVSQIYEITKEDLEILSNDKMKKITIEFDNAPKSSYVPQNIYIKRAQSNFKCALENIF